MTASEGTFDPVTYAMPLRRLLRLRRSGMRRSYSGIWYFAWGWIGLFCASLLAMAVFPASARRMIWSLSRSLGLSYETMDLLFFATVLTVFLAGIVLNRRLLRAENKTRIDFDSAITLRPVANGLHFAGKQLEYIVKWAGIHELLREPDGIVVVCGGMFFLVPDRAFATVDARHAFLDHVNAHLTPEARARSETELQRARRQ
ncbi:MAG: hypothetical protein WAN86_00180 [Hyphomicrobiaceae bacterium]